MRCDWWSSYWLHMWHIFSLRNNWFVLGDSVGSIEIYLNFICVRVSSYYISVLSLASVFYSFIKKMDYATLVHSLLLCVTNEGSFFGVCDFVFLQSWHAGGCEVSVIFSIFLLFLSQLLSVPPITIATAT